MDVFEGTIVEMEFGSHLYGLNNEKSDRDYVGVYLPTLREVVMKHDSDTIDFSTNKKTKNGPEDIDRKFYSLWKFIDGCKKGNTDVLDMLHANDNNIIRKTPIWDILVENRHHAYTKNMKSLVGYLKTQANKYGVKGSRIASVKKVLAFCSSVKDKHSLIGEYAVFLPAGEYISFETTNHPSTGEQHFYVVCGRKYQDSTTVESLETNLNNLLDKYGHRAKEAADNNGIDWKAVSHALRVGYQLRELYATGTYSFPLTERDYIMSVKEGKLKMEDVRRELDFIVDEVTMLSETSNFPENVNCLFWDEIFRKIVAEEYKNEAI